MSLYYTRMYSTIFERILCSDVQYDFWFYTALGRTVWFYLREYYTRTYSIIFQFILHSDAQYNVLREYYTRTYRMIFDFILHSDVQYDFWFYTTSDIQYDFWLNTILGRIVWFLNLYCTRMYNMNFGKNALHLDIQCGFLREYYTQTYSKIFERILYSDV